MSVGEGWKACFAAWPDKLPQRGMLVTTFDEQIAFSAFFTGDSILLIERQTPDTVGARKVLVPYENIAAVKIIDVVKTKDLLALGFEDKRKAKEKSS